MSADTAPAAMPSGEIRRIIEDALCEPNTVEFAVASLEALFAPILAERDGWVTHWQTKCQATRTLELAAEARALAAEAERDTGKERADMAVAQMVKQNDRVRELSLLLDKQMGTPCEQIRLRQEVEAALAAERERCAKIAERDHESFDYDKAMAECRDYDCGYANGRQDAAAAIRAQGE